MSNHLKIYLFVFKAKANKSGKAPLILRLKYLKQTAQISTGYLITPSNWLKDKYRVRKHEKNADIINQHITNLQLKVSSIYSKMYQDGDIYLQKIIDIIKGKEVNTATLMELVSKYNSAIKSRVNHDLRIATYKKYMVTEHKLKDFLFHCGKNDIRLKDLRYSFIEEFNVFMKSHYGNDQNTTCKHLKILKTYLKYAASMELINRSPFIDYKASYKPKEKPYLTIEELKLVESKSFTIKRLQLVKDLFLIQCYTGLSFSDLVNLRGIDIITGIDGNLWIIKNRLKTSVRSSIPLLPRAIDLISKYSPDFKTYYDKEIFPKYSIQSYNSYLREIMDLCGVNKPLSSHAGRRTFATTVALSNGISIESIAQMLGHSSIKITHQYARVSDLKIASEMERLKTKF